MKHNQPRVSVALCTYNGEKYIEKQLESITIQTHLPDEIIISDDSSTDNTLNIINDFLIGSSIKSIIHRNTNNIGYVKNFEKAISLCTGDIILLSDQDDIWLSHRVEQSIKVLTDNPSCGYVFSDADLIDDKGTDLNKTLWRSICFTEKRISKFKIPELQAHVLYPDNCVTGATLAFRANSVPIILPFPILPTIIHDGWIALTLSMAGQFGVALEKPLIQYRIHSGQQLGVGTETKHSKVIKYLKEKLSGRKRLFKDRIYELSVVNARLDEAWEKGILNSKSRYIDNYIINMQKRLEIISNTPRLRRVTLIIKLYLEGFYDNNSSAFLSAIKDIILYK